MPANEDSTELDDPSTGEALAAKTDDYLRLAADFDNYRKRTRRDSEQKAAAEKETFIRELLPVIDNLERALAFVPAATSASLQEGVQMTLRQLMDLLKRHGLEVVDPVGQPFDPHQHEALAVRPDSVLPDHHVLEVIQRGYRRGEQVFRPAQVIVSERAVAAEHDHGR